jgi:uncharacterized protein (DUF1330 family)
MPAYVIVEVSIHDAAMYEEYKKLTPAAIAAYGGKFIIRGAQTECLEGDWNPERIVVLQFESVDKAKEWWSSAQYTVAKKIRQASAFTKMLVVDGCEG